MPLDNEIHTLLGLVIGAIKTKVEDAGDEAKSIAEAGEEAMHTLGSLVLSDIKRIADSLEILAKAELDRAKPLLSTAGGSS